MSNPALQGWLLYYRGRVVRVRHVFAAGVDVGSFPSVSKIDDAFWPIFVRDCIAMGVNPRDIAAVMLAESVVNPRAVNIDRNEKSPTFGEPLALGLNQLFRSNWGMLGDLSPDDYLALPASAQWSRVVAPFFRGVLRSHPSVLEAAPEDRARDLYWINFLSDPALYHPGSGDDFVITDKPKFVNGNRGLTLNGENVIRAGGLRAFLRKAQTDNNARWDAVLRAIDATEQGLGPNIPQPAPQAAPGGSEPSTGPGIGTVLALAAVAGGAWFVYSSYHAGSRLKGALTE